LCAFSSSHENHPFPRSARHHRLLAADYPRVIFSDDFAAEGFGKAGGTTKAPASSKAACSLASPRRPPITARWTTSASTGERDLQVSVKFRFVSDKAKSFNVWFDDKNYKGSHAGHICQATISRPA
jgi:hypothetical protein